MCVFCLLFLPSSVLFCWYLISCRFVLFLAYSFSFGLLQLLTRSVNSRYAVIYVIYILTALKHLPNWISRNRCHKKPIYLLKWMFFFKWSNKRFNFFTVVWFLLHASPFHSCLYAEISVEILNSFKNLIYFNQGFKRNLGWQLNVTLNAVTTKKYQKELFSFLLCIFYTKEDRGMYFCSIFHR